MMMMNCLYCFSYDVEVPDRFGPAEVEDDEDEDDGWRGRHSVAGYDERVYFSEWTELFDDGLVDSWNMFYDGVLLSVVKLS